jgi:hypothetical protein
MATFSKLSLAAKNIFHKNLFVSNTVTCMVLLALGDGLAQYAEISEKQKAEAKSPPQNASKLSLFDWNRNWKMFALGSALGPVTHFWYKNLDHWFPGRTRKILLRKICVDQLFGATLMTLTLIVGLHFLDGQSMNPIVVKETVEEKFFPIFKVIFFKFSLKPNFNNLLLFFFIPLSVIVLYGHLLTS